MTQGHENLVQWRRSIGDRVCVGLEVQGPMALGVPGFGEGIERLHRVVVGHWTSCWKHPRLACQVNVEP